MKKIIFLLIICFFSYVLGVYSVRNCIFPFCSDIKYKVKNFLNDTEINVLKNNKKIQNDINIESHLANLDIELISLPETDYYGSIKSFNEKVFFLSQKSNLYVYNNESKNFDNLQISKPDIGYEKFVDFLKKNTSPGNIQKFGTRDFLLFGNGLTGSLYISSLAFDSTNQCVFLGVYKSNFNKKPSIWENVFKSSPCVKNFKGTLASWGGKLEKINYNKFLLSVGDAFHDGVNNPNLTTNKNSSYGKVFSFSADSDKFTLFTRGHRNPQGLHFDGEIIFETEHGPVGGDELNILHEGNDYGWPLETYGKEYSTNSWPLNENDGFHLNSSQPKFSWIPSIGISDLTKIPDSSLTPWRGDIIVSSLSSRSINRIRFSKNGNLQNIENIIINHRIRSIEYHDDSLYFISDNEGLMGIVTLN
jgi:hypothetical protein